MSKATASILTNFRPHIKFKLAALWTTTTFCYLYGDYFELYTPGKVDSLLSGKNILDTPVLLLKEKRFFFKNYVNYVSMCLIMNTLRTSYSENYAFLDLEYV
ncbi:MAG: hypothetical protein AAGI23_19170 [Bacteroidota bacterium]